MKGSSFPRVSAVRSVVIGRPMEQALELVRDIELLEPLERKARAAASPAMNASGARGLPVAVADRRDAPPEGTRRDAGSAPDRSDHRTGWITRGVIGAAPSAQPPESGGHGVQPSSRTATGCTDAIRMFSEKPGVDRGV